MNAAWTLIAEQESLLPLPLGLPGVMLLTTGIQYSLYLLAAMARVVCDDVVFGALETAVKAKQGVKTSTLLSVNTTGTMTQNLGH